METKLTTTPVPASGWLTTVDKLVSEAQGLEPLLASLIPTLVPALGPYLPEIAALLNLIASAMHKAAGTTPTNPPVTP